MQRWMEGFRVGSKKNNQNDEQGRGGVSRVMVLKPYSTGASSSSQGVWDLGEPPNLLALTFFAGKIKLMN